MLLMRLLMLSCLSGTLTTFFKILDCGNKESEVMLG